MSETQNPHLTTPTTPILKTHHFTVLYYAPEQLGDGPQYAVQSEEDFHAGGGVVKLPMNKTDQLQVSSSGEVIFHKTNLGEISQSRAEVDQFLALWHSGLSQVAEDPDLHVQESNSRILGTLRQVLELSRDQFTYSATINTRIVSWNLHGDAIYEKEDEKFDKLLKDQPQDDSCDLLVVCFQETIPLNAKNLSSSLERVLLWGNRILSYLPASFTQIKSNRLLGLTVMVFASSKIADQVSAVSTSTIGTGLLGLWANKGAIVMSLRLGADENLGVEGLELQFINCHLASGHGREMLDHRRKELYDIQRKFRIVGDGELVDENWAESSYGADDGGAYEGDYEGDYDGANSDGAYYDDYYELEREMTHVELDEGFEIDSEVESGSDNELIEGVKELRKGDFGENDLLKGENELIKGENHLSEDSNHLSKDVNELKQPSKIVNEANSHVNELNKPSKIVNDTKSHGNDPKKPSVNHHSQPTYDSDSSSSLSPPNGVTFYCGDLNYRIFLPREELDLLLQQGNFDALLAADGLTQEKAAGKIFLNFKEGPISFQPTYKYLVGTDEYVQNRIPAFCDRILYTPHAALEQLSYGPCPELLSSDHKPIAANFSLNCRLIDHKARAQIVAQFLKKQDKLENDSRPVVEISRQDIPPLTGHYLIPNSTSTLLKNNGPIPLSWEIAMVEDSARAAVVSISPLSGELEPGMDQVIDITGVLPIGMPEFHSTCILRVHNAQDFFISYSFKCRPDTVFGKDLALMGGSSGIPKAIYQYVNYLGEHNYQGMFAENKDTSKLTSLDQQLIRDLDDGKDLDLDLLASKLMIESIKSVAKILYLLLKSVPNGIVSSETTSKLINHFYNESKNKNLLKKPTASEEISAYLLEISPKVQLNCLIFLANFLKVLIKDYNFDRDKLMKDFQGILFQIPSKLSKRKMVTDSNVRNLKKRRNELLKILLKY